MLAYVRCWYKDVGVRALLIHAENAARQFYRRLAAFEASPVDELQLMLLIEDLPNAVRRSAL